MAADDPRELLKLEQGWDSYDGHPPDEATVEFAETIAAELGPQFDCPPQFVPCNGGEIQIEWHCNGWDVEVFISNRETRP